MMMYLALFACQFAFVFLKAFQQRNVAFDQHGWVIPTSFAMAAFEVTVVALVAKIGISQQTVGAIAAVGLGGGLGATAAMRLHAAMFPRG